jgi:hypothetical protein
VLIVNCMHNDTCAGRTNGGKARRVEPCEPGPVGLGASQQYLRRSVALLTGGWMLYYYLMDG